MVQQEKSTQKWTEDGSVHEFLNISIIPLPMKTINCMIKEINFISADIQVLFKNYINCISIPDSKLHNILFIHTKRNQNYFNIIEYLNVLHDAITYNLCYFSIENILECKQFLSRMIECKNLCVSSIVKVWQHICNF